MIGVKNAKRVFTFRFIATSFAFLFLNIPKWREFFLNVFDGNRPA